MKTIFHYLTATVICGSALTALNSYGAEVEPSAINVYPPSYSLVSLDAKKIKDVGDIQGAQEEYIKKKHEGCQISFSMYLKDGEGRFIQTFVIENDGHKKSYVSFDMGEIYNKLKKKDKETREKVEALEKKH